MGNKLTLSTALSYLSQVAQVTFSFPSFCLFPFRHWLKPRALSLTLRALVLSLKLPTPHPTAQLYDELNRSIPETPPASTDSTGNPVAFSLPLLHILSPNGRPEFTACLSCCISLLCVVQQMEPWSPELYVCSTTVLAPHSLYLSVSVCLCPSSSLFLCPLPPLESTTSLELSPEINESQIWALTSCSSLFSVSQTPHLHIQNHCKYTPPASQPDFPKVWNPWI